MLDLDISGRILRREAFDPYRVGVGEDAGRYGIRRVGHVPGLYGDLAWVHGLDIVNELGGHTGCVNALSWSKSGKFLASGSDDTHVNIHKYDSENSSTPFTLATTIGTGHSANIFSVKFMPHSNDSTIVSCAGDHQVRVFDIEHSSRAGTTAQGAPGSARHHSGVNLQELYRGVQFLGPSSTDARIYRSHSDRVKRIVTESSPHLFLTCSEDGEVRQWDMRLPSSAYPSPRNGSRRDQEGRVPPPLISYKRFRLDLNTISCSSTQPHYIVLGGAHLHAFLHDRRMLGRDTDAERGTPVRSSSSMSEHEEDLMGKATKCVRRFAPNGRKKMTQASGHITACKISDANPNEMIGSWSGDHIYSFNLVASPDVRESETEKVVQIDASDKPRRSGGNDLKRKRQLVAHRSTTSMEGVERGSPRTRSAESNDSNVALRVRYGNGQSEDISLDASSSALHEGRENIETESQRRCMRTAKAVSKIRDHLFCLKSTAHFEPSSSLSAHAASFSDALERASIVLSEMEAISSGWTYPMLPDAETVTLQSTMRRNRVSSQRFVQAAGTLARALGGSIRTTDETASRMAVDRFSNIDSENRLRSVTGSTFGSEYQKFCYLFLAAIVAWLRGGIQGVLAWFKPEAAQSGHFSVVQSDAEEAVHEKIIPGLRALATQQERAIVNIDASRFEVDENRILFERGVDAVVAFGQVIRIPMDGHAAADAWTQGFATSPAALTQDKETALRYWGFKVGRGLLLSAGEGVNYAFVNSAFGGLRVHSRPSEGRSQRGIDIDEDEERIERVSLARPTENASNATVGGANNDLAAPRDEEEGEESENDNGDGDGDDDHEDDEEEEEERVDPMDLRAILRQRGLVTDEYDEYGDEHADDTPDLVVFGNDQIVEAEAEGDSDWEDEEDEEEDGEVDEGVDGDEDEFDNEDDIDDFNDEPFDPCVIFQDASALGRNRDKVEATVPCADHTCVYEGHANTQTVKDVNYFGLEDEYVVSGSDSGHVFIWHRQTGMLLNILEADQEVVNVIQGHPYEPLLAVSGIDHTIKIFSPDRRAQTDARRGINLGTLNQRSHGQSRVLHRRAPRNPAATTATTTGSETVPSHPLHSLAVAADGWLGDEGVDIRFEKPSNEGLASCRRMADQRAITDSNDVMRRGGMEDAFFTRSMLAHLAVRMRERREGAAGNGAGGEGNVDDNDEDGEAHELEDDCMVM